MAWHEEKYCMPAQIPCSVAPNLLEKKMTLKYGALKLQVELMMLMGTAESKAQEVILGQSPSAIGRMLWIIYHQSILNGHFSELARVAADGAAAFQKFYSIDAKFVGNPAPSTLGLQRPVASTN
ncbi:hypothetical protein Leryth_007204 [Lithospermum erythrorhizon]|nr:hypothetical protein Leryth_007204 [Lithospermum erythrorhizon]